MTDKEDEPKIGSWVLSLKEMSALCRCVDARLLLFLAHGPTMSAGPMAEKLVQDFCQCLMDTGICSEDTAKEVLEQIKADAKENHKRLMEESRFYANATAQFFKRGEAENSEGPTEGV